MCIIHITYNMGVIFRRRVLVVRNPSVGGRQGRRVACALRFRRLWVWKKGIPHSVGRLPSFLAARAGSRSRPNAHDHRKGPIGELYIPSVSSGC